MFFYMLRCCKFEENFQSANNIRYRNTYVAKSFPILFGSLSVNLKEKIQIFFALLKIDVSYGEQISFDFGNAKIIKKWKNKQRKNGVATTWRNKQR